MANWVQMALASLLPGEPWTSAKAIAAFENVEALAEGAPGAPRIKSAALELDFITNKNASYTTADLWGGIKGVGYIHGESGLASQPVAIQYRTSDDGGTTKSSWANLASRNIGTGFTQSPMQPFDIAFAAPINFIEFREDGDTGGDALIEVFGLMTGVV